jgi:hypothetical protein
VSDFHPAVDLIISRLENTPEDTDTFKHMASEYARFMSSEEKAAIQAALRESQLTMLHQRVMGHILGKEKTKK